MNRTTESLRVQAHRMLALTARAWGLPVCIPHDSNA
jgi:hypothetical protein